LNEFLEVTHSRMGESMASKNSSFLFRNIQVTTLIAFSNESNKNEEVGNLVITQCIYSIDEIFTSGDAPMTGSYPL
jgi:hypothetical protein